VKFVAFALDFRHLNLDEGWGNDYDALVGAGTTLDEDGSGDG
jgi:hypothetical protein